jgi:DNA-binding response OmpR family regulator
MRIAVVEDERALAGALKRGLEAEENAVDLFYDAASAKERLAGSGGLYDLVILDLMLPDEPGAEVCTTLRSTGVRSPILVLTALHSTEDKVSLLDRGADDYLTKPFAFDELLARSRALTRRAEGKEAEVSVGDLTLLPESRKAHFKGTALSLTASEFEILLYLVRAAGRAVRREELATKALGEAEKPETNIIDVHIRNIRKKLGDSHARKFVQTVHGVGYRIAR